MKSLIHNNKEYAFVTEKNGKRYYREISNADKNNKPKELELTGDQKKEIKIKDEKKKW